MKNKFIFSVATAVLCSLFVFGCSGDTKPKESQKSSVEASSITDTASVKTFELTPQQYAKRFNKFAKELNLPFKLNPKVKKGAELDTFQALFNDNLGMVGSVDKKTGKLSGIILIGSGNGTVASGANIIFSAAAAISAANPKGKLSDTGKELVTLIQEREKSGQEQSLKLINDVQVIYSRNDQVGNMFVLAPNSN